MFLFFFPFSFSNKGYLAEFILGPDGNDTKMKTIFPLHSLPWSDGCWHYLTTITCTWNFSPSSYNCFCCCCSKRNIHLFYIYLMTDVIQKRKVYFLKLHYLVKWIFTLETILYIQQRRYLGSVIHIIRILLDQLFRNESTPIYLKPVWLLSTCEKLQMKRPKTYD